MPLYLSEDDVARLLAMEACIEAVEEAFRHHAAGRADSRPRSRARVRGGILHVLPAASEALGRLAVKSYATTRGGARFVVLLFDLATSDLLAVIEADRLGQMRTGAASAVATRRMAREDADSLGILGTGWQARGQVRAIASVRSLREIRAFGRDEGRLRAFCGEIEAGLGIRTVPAESAAAAVRGAGVVVTATTSPTPVLPGSWLEPGMHVNAVGSNRFDRHELDAAAVSRADRVVVDSLEQARIEAGDLLPVIERAVELSSIVSGASPGRSGRDDITLFRSLGIGLEDLAAASLVYDRAVASSAGRRIPGPGG